MKNNNRKIKLRIYFAILTTITIFNTCAMFVVYLALSVKNLLGEYNGRIEIMSNTLSTIISLSIKTDAKNGNFEASSKIVELLKDQGRLKYLYLKDLRSGDIIIGNDSTFALDTSKADKNKVRQFTRRLTPRYEIYGAIPYEHMNVNIYGSFSRLIWQVLLIFVALGAIISYFMANIISEPLNRLSKAARQITSGNFSIHIDESNFYEIDDLIYSYNEMTYQLNEL